MLARFQRPLQPSVAKPAWAPPGPRWWEQHKCCHAATTHLHHLYTFTDLLCCSRLSPEAYAGSQYRLAAINPHRQAPGRIDSFSPITIRAAWYLFVCCLDINPHLPVQHLPRLSAHHCRGCHGHDVATVRR